MPLTIVHNRPTKAIKTVLMSLITDGSGAASSTTDPIRGYLIRCVILPHALIPPTTLWDVTFVDQYGANLLQNSANSMLNLPTTSTQRLFVLIGSTLGMEYPSVDGPITVTVANGGDSKVATMVLQWCAERIWAAI
jgi:hypothetical protein